MALELYGNGDLTLRQVAEVIRVKFNLPSFSASTVSRALKKTLSVANDENLATKNGDKNADENNNEHNDTYKCETKIADNICKQKRQTSAIKIKDIKSLFETYPKVSFVEGKIENLMLFVKTWYDKFSKHFLIASSIPNNYVLP
jgi:hypothetical protein